MWYNSARWWLVAEVNAMEPLCAGDTLPCICPFAEVLVARDGVTHDHERPRYALLVALRAEAVRQETALRTAAEHEA